MTADDGMEMFDVAAEGGGVLDSPWPWRARTDDMDPSKVGRRGRGGTPQPCRAALAGIDRERNECEESMNEFSCARDSMERRSRSEKRRSSRTGARPRTTDTVTAGGRLMSCCRAVRPYGGGVPGRVRIAAELEVPVGPAEASDDPASSTARTEEYCHADELAFSVAWTEECGVTPLREPLIETVMISAITSDANSDTRDTRFCIVRVRAASGSKWYPSTFLNVLFRGFEMSARSLDRRRC